MDFRDSLSWRIYRNDAAEHYMFFDAAREVPGTRILTEGERSAYLDSVGSVSAVDLDLDQLELLNGCKVSSSLETPSDLLETLWEGFSE